MSAYGYDRLEGIDHARRKRIESPSIASHITCYLRVVSGDRVPLYVRLPKQQAAALDQLSGQTGRPKQHLVSEMLGDQLSVGHLELRESHDAEAVLTLAEAAAMLRLPVEAVLGRANAGELPAAGSQASGALPVRRC
jgi:hypothetical protein